MPGRQARLLPFRYPSNSHLRCDRSSNHHCCDSSDRFTSTGGRNGFLSTLSPARNRKLISRFHGKTSHESIPVTQFQIPSLIYTIGGVLVDRFIRIFVPQRWNFPPPPRLKAESTWSPWRTNLVESNLYSRQVLKFQVHSHSISGFGGFLSIARVLVRL